MLTAAKNEGKYIEGAILSVLRQSKLPVAWFIVDDGSTDETAALVRRYAELHPWIVLVSRPAGAKRNFGAKSAAIQAAFESAKLLQFDFLGIQDADIEVVADTYYESVLGALTEEPLLGISGGYIFELQAGQWKPRPANSNDSVAGGIQMFRRVCFEKIGGFTPMPFGGEDWLTEIEARRAGWTVRAMPNLAAHHFRPTSSADGRLLGLIRLGMMDGSFGSHPVFEVFKCARRVTEKPMLLGSILRFTGYLWWHLARRRPLLQPDKVAFLRSQQMQKLSAAMSRLKELLTRIEMKTEDEQLQCDLGLGTAMFERLLDMAEERLARRELDSCIALAQMAARLAFPANAGRLASTRLEQLLVRTGRLLADDAPAPREPTPRSSDRIVHVLTYARPVGGDTRFAWRWMEEDAQNTHSAVITSQADLSAKCEIPPELHDAVHRSGGSVHVLRSLPSQPIRQALELRVLARQAGTVVLHLFPYDVIPILALATGCDSARIIFVNHSDHTFWLGSSVAHVVLNLRSQPEHALAYRGLRPDGTALLPIPLANPQPRLAKPSVAKAALGYSADTVVLLTVASPFKFSSPGLPGFLELVLPVLIEHQNVVLVAVGPTPHADWQQASELTGGRVMALGTRYDTSELYDAADIYLDSVPFSSITSILEAGIRGVPLLGLAPADTALALLGPSAPGLDSSMLISKDIADYRRLLRRLIGDSEHRSAVGHRSREQILALHTGPNWLDAVRQAYLRAAGASAQGCLADGLPTELPASLAAALLRLYGPLDTRFLRRLLWRFLSPLPYPQRLSIVWSLYQQGLFLSIPNLLPTWMNVLARRIARALAWRRWPIFRSSSSELRHQANRVTSA